MRFARVMLVMVCMACSAHATGSPRQVIIDTDPGTDDAIAIALALRSPELSVRALTIVPGNVAAAQGVDNARRIVSLAQRCDVPVAAGARRPLVATLTTGEVWHGRNGLADILLPEPRCPLDRRWAPDLIIETVRAAPHQVTLLTLGPLTNVALALEKDPGIVPLVDRVIMMAGSTSGGNVTAAAEFNIYVDPEAAELVFNAGWPITMVGLDVCRKTLLTRRHLQPLAGDADPLAHLVFGIGSFLVDAAERYGASGAALYDPLTVGAAIDSTLITTTPLRIDVETGGGLTRGETVANREGTRELIELRPFPDGARYVFTGGTQKVAPNAAVATEVQAGRFLDLLLSRIRSREASARSAHVNATGR